MQMPASLMSTTRFPGLSKLIQTKAISYLRIVSNFDLIAGDASLALLFDSVPHRRLIPVELRFNRVQ